MTDVDGYCYQCLFAGGTHIVKDKSHRAYCEFSKYKLAYLKKSDPKKDTDVEVIVNQGLTYEILFNGMEKCAGLENNVKRKDLI